MTDSALQLYEGPAVVAFLVSKLREQYPDSQVGKTAIQKMLYLLSREHVVDFDYTLFHYGPFSFEAASALDFAAGLGLVTTEWVPERGYNIAVTGSAADYFKFVSAKAKRAAEKAVEKFGGLLAIELSIMATALYLKDELGIPPAQLASQIHAIKPQFSKYRIQKVLEKTGVLGA
jgi:uncharacterized protein YwgA